MKAHFITMFKQPLEEFLKVSLLGRAQNKGLININVHSLLDFINGKHHHLDDSPYGGGPGELLRVDKIVEFLRIIFGEAEIKKPARRIILLDPAGKRFDQSHAKRLATYEEIVFLAGRYEGIDARIHNYVDEAMSLGDFVMSNGDIAAMAMFDAIVRMKEGVLGNIDSIADESHMNGRLEASHYTRPEIFEGYSVPKVLTQGNHKEILLYKCIESLLRTQKIRPDMLEKYPILEEEKKLLAKSDNNEQYPWERSIVT